MSLIHWWPLNGNLNDYGVKNQSLTNSNASIDNTGKIGKCYSFNGSSARLSLAQQETLDYPLTISAWIYPTGLPTSGTQYVFSYNTATGGTAGHAIGFGFYNSSSNLAVWYKGNVNTTSFAMSNNNWYHIVLSIDTNNNIKTYVNGNLISELTSSSTKPSSIWFTLGARCGSSTGGVGGANYFFKGKINDVRIYDHALSLKEVKEISKGLVLHYDFEDEYAEGTTNLLSANMSKPVSGWGAWKASGDASTISFLTGDGAFGNNYCKVTCAAGSTSCTAPHFDDYSLTANTTYTYSCYVKGDSTSIGKTISWSCSPNGIGYSNLKTQSIVLTAQWQRVSSTITLTEAPSGSKRLQPMISVPNNAHSSSAINIYTCNFQKEAKNHATPWILGGTTRSNGLIYDNSGYGYNGTQYGNALQIVGDSACGEHSAKFNNTINSAIVCGNGMLVKDEITVNWWGYMSNWANYGRALSCTEGGGWNFEPNSSKMAFPLYLSGIGYKSAVSTTTLANLSAGWHMFTGAYDGYTNKIYIDGVLEGSISSGASSKTAIAYAANGLFIGAEAAGNATTPTSPYFNGNIADVKIYATALSASDILAEYQTKASIDKNGNFFCGEFLEENNKSNVTKTGITRTSHFEEGTSLVKMLDGYTELEYLEVSSAGPYINTNVTYASDLLVEDTIMYTQITTSSAYYINGIDQTVYWGRRDTKYFTCGGSANTQMAEANKKYALTINMSSKTLHANGTLVDTRTGSINGSGNIYLFASKQYNGTNTSYFSSDTRRYSTRIFKSGELVRNFIPAKRNSDNVLGMYDTVNRVFYTNSGTGTFIAGPEKGNLSVIYSNQIIER